MLRCHDCNGDIAEKHEIQTRIAAQFALNVARDRSSIGIGFPVMCQPGLEVLLDQSVERGALGTATAVHPRYAGAGRGTEMRGGGRHRCLVKVCGSAKVAAVWPADASEIEPDRAEKGFLCAIVVLPTRVIAADETDIVLVAGPGRDKVQAFCSMCHSLDYIVMNSPFQDKAAWEKSVKKMVTVMAAPLTPEDVAAIVAYLDGHYGKQPSADAPH